MNDREYIKKQIEVQQLFKELIIVIFLFLFNVLFVMLGYSIYPISKFQVNPFVDLSGNYFFIMIGLFMAVRGKNFKRNVEKKLKSLNL